MEPKFADEFLESMAEIFRMLSDPSRLRILRAVMAQEMNVTAIVDETGLSQANVSKHLRLLYTGGLVTRRREGLQVYYELENPVVQRICELVCKTLLAESDAGQSTRRSKRK